MEYNICSDFVAEGFKVGQTIHIKGSFWKRLWQFIRRKPQSSGTFTITSVEEGQIEIMKGGG